MKGDRKVIEIVRKTKTELTDSVYDDFLNIMYESDLYDVKNHTRSRHSLSYNFGRVVFRFSGLDQPQKKRGPRRDVLFINEANGITLEDYIQTSIRTREKIVIDYNPSIEFWAHDLFINNPDAIEGEDYEYVHSTYLDNINHITGESFLPEDQRKRLEALSEVDDYYYKVYTLGVLARLKGQIFGKLKYVSADDYEQAKYAETWYGLDFGYEHPTVLTEIKYFNEEIYLRSLWWKSHKYDDDLIKFMNETRISKSEEIYCDHLPASIKKLREAGFNARKADKQSVSDRLRFCQSFQVNIHPESKQLYKQMSRYKYKQTPDGHIIEEPVKMEDDGPDSVCYGIYTHLKRRINRIGVKKYSMHEKSYL